MNNSKLEACRVCHQQVSHSALACPNCGARTEGALPKDHGHNPLTPCRDCNQQVYLHAGSCPKCGAAKPADEDFTGYGFEYKSGATLMGLPLLHVSFKYRPDRVWYRRPLPAKGFIAIGQFATGVITISQFGIGLVSLSQFTIAGLAIAQFAFAVRGLAQFGIYIEKGYGQLTISLMDLIQKLI